MVSCELAGDACLNVSATDVHYCPDTRIDLPENVQAWRRFRLLIRRSWAEAMRGDWKRLAKMCLLEVVGLSALTENSFLEILGIWSCREEMESLEVRPTMQNLTGSVGDQLAAIGNVRDMCWYGELALFRELAFVAEFGLSPSASLTAEAIVQHMEFQLHIFATRRQASGVLQELRRLMPQGARHVFLVPKYIPHPSEHDEIASMLESHLNKVATDDFEEPAAIMPTTDIDTCEVSPDMVGNDDAVGDSSLVSTRGITPALLSSLSLGTSGGSMSPDLQLSGTCVISDALEPIANAAKMKMELARLAYRQSCIVTEFVSEHAVVYGHDFSSWPRVRLPIRADFFQQWGTEWRLAMKYCLAKYGGLREWPLEDLQIVAVRTLEDEMLSFEQRPAVRAQPHYAAPTTVDHEARLPSVARLRDAQWYGQLDAVREPAIVVEVAISPEVNHPEFVHALSTEIDTNNFARLASRTPLQHSSVQDGRRLLFEERFEALHIRDAVPNEVRQLYAFPPLPVPAAPPRVRSATRRNPFVGRQLRLGGATCSPPGLSKHASPLRSRRYGPPGSLRNFCASARAWQ